MNQPSPQSAPAPALEVVTSSAAPDAVVLVLHGGREHSHDPVEPHQLAVRRMRPFARDIARHVPAAAVACLRYRRRGWNGDGGDTLADVAHAIGELDARFPGVPLVLLGHSLGGRAAVNAAGAPSVRGVVALAPWLPDGEPVAQLAGRSLVVLHGTRDMTTSSAASARFAQRSRGITTETVCLRVPRSGHGMVVRAGLWHRLATGFVAAMVAGEPLDHATAAAVGRGCRPCADGGASTDAP